MNRYTFIITLFLQIILLGSCSILKPPVSDDFELTILQLNDVYEIAPLEGGKAGGLARVATIKKELLKENPNTIAILAGDFLSPSFIANVKDENGEKIAGRQMVEALNVMGLDLATFGNHEFDFDNPDIVQKRINQSQFEYTCCNVFRIKDGKAQAFTQNVNGLGKDIPKYTIKEYESKQGKKVKVGFIGVLLPFNQQDYLKYDEVITSFKNTYQDLSSKVDFVIGITHLNIAQDIELAKEVTGVPLFLGGHDHNNQSHYVEETIITKADANAKTVYIHRLKYNLASKMLDIRSTLKEVNETIPNDESTQEVVDSWQKKIDEIFKEQGYDPSVELKMLDDELVCTEVKIRSEQTNFGKLAGAALEYVVPGADLYVINSGSMRLDDNLSGIITQYDILRTFPFGGGVVKFSLSGDVVKKMLNVGLIENVNEGGYLQVPNVRMEGQDFLIGNQVIKSTSNYMVVMPKFLAEGREKNLEFLGGYSSNMPEYWELNDQRINNDIRDILIAYLIKD